MSYRARTNTTSSKKAWLSLTNRESTKTANSESVPKTNSSSEKEPKTNTDSSCTLKPLLSHQSTSMESIRNTCPKQKENRSEERRVGKEGRSRCAPGSGEDE